MIAPATVVACPDPAAGDEAPIDPLAHGGLVASIVAMYRHRGVDEADLVQAGYLGLMVAIRRFDRRQGFQFSTYAYRWVRTHVRQVACRSRGVLELSPYVYDWATQLRRGVRPAIDGHPLSAETLSAIPAAVSCRAVRDDGSDGGFRITTGLVDRRERSPAAVAADRATVADLLRCLTDRERQVLVGLYGLDGRAAGNFEDLGRELGFTPQRARQLANRALDKLRRRAGSDYKGASRMWDGRKTAGARARGRGAACNED